MLLRDYGYNIIPDDHREQQYRCDLHGIDNKPSARYYPRTNSVYCFACGKSRDPVSLVMDKEALTFRDACNSLEERFDLPALPWDEDVTEEARSVVDDLDAIVESGVTFEREAARLNRLLDNIVLDKDLDVRVTLGFVEVYDRIMYGVKKQDWPEPEGKTAFGKLHRRIMEKLKERHASRDASS